MHRVAASDRTAFAQLVERHRMAVMRLAYGVVRDRAEAEDIVQEAFTRVWTKAAAWEMREGARFFAWLARITINLAIDQRRRPRHQEAGIETERAEAPGLSADQLLIGREIGARIRRAMGRLPERQRLAFALCQIEQMANADAARCLDISVGALELLLVRARKALRLDLRDLMEGS